MEIDEIIHKLQIKKIELTEMQLEVVKEIIPICIHVVYDDSLPKKLRSNSFCFLKDIVYDMRFEIEDRWSIYRILVGTSFIYPDLSIYIDDVRETYIHLYLHVESVLLNDIKVVHVEKNVDDKTIILLTDQFLGVQHSPTRQILDYAYSFQKALGYKVVIINTGVACLVEKDYIPILYKPNYVDDYSELSSFEYQGEKIEFIQCPNNPLNYELLVNQYLTISEINPRCVISIGDSSILGDLCHNFTCSMSIPCQITVPISMGNILLTPGNADILCKERNIKLYPWQKMVETIFNFSVIKEGIIYKREDYDIPKESFVISIIGNRLEQEFTNKFIDLLSRVLDISDNIKIVIIGKIDRYKKELDETLGKSVLMLGKISNSSRFMGITDLVVQPERAGGGRSTVEALAYGVPVVVTRFGDSFHNAGNEFSVGSYEDMYEEICKLFKDNLYYKEKSKLAEKRYFDLSDIVGTISKWMEYIE